MVEFFAVVGKDNEPLFFLTNTEESETLHFQFLVHSCLDVVEERKGRYGRQTSSASSLDQYLGLLCPMEEYKIYGYVTNTHIKFILLLNGSRLVDDDQLKQFFQEIHGAYIRLIINPFTPLILSASVACELPTMRQSTKFAGIQSFAFEELVTESVSKLNDLVLRT